MQPNFLVIGAMKSATTSLCALLDKHPDVFLSLPKEPEFFCRDAVYRRGMPWYEALFADGREKPARGEGSTSYTKALRYPHAATRIAENLPKAKLIYIARHPLDRIRSHWMHDRINGTIGSHESFATSVRTRPEMLDTSLYWRQIECYRRRFAEHQLLVLFYEDFRRDPPRELAKCLRFLGLRELSLIDEASQRRNVSAQRPCDGMLLKAIKRSHAGAEFVFRFKHALPSSLRSRLTRLSKRKRTITPPEWNQSTWDWATARIQPDSRQFLATYGKPADYWDFTCAREQAVAEAV